jgi:hypothetical protein
MQEEAAKELIDPQGHEPFPVAVSGISPAEGDVSVGQSNQPMVGNGDTMGVGAEIAQHMFWPAEGLFGIDDPVVTEQYPQPGGALSSTWTDECPRFPLWSTRFLLLPQRRSTVDLKVPSVEISNRRELPETFKDLLLLWFALYYGSDIYAMANRS